MTAKAETKRKRGPGRPPKTVVSGVNDMPPTEDLVAMYKDMLLIRRFEEKAGQLYGMGQIGGFCHLYIGQEAVVVGLQSASKPGDTVVTSYRDHGHMLACGMDADGVMAELTGREGGYSRGKGGSMHMFSREKNFFGGHGIVGAQVPIGVGLAFSHKYKNEPNVCMTYLGDGAVNQGQVYESFNMAALWSLPVVFVIENNQYGMGTSVSRAAAGLDLAAAIGQPICLKPNMRQAIPTGFAMALPAGYEAQIRPRSGLALKYGITVANAPGTIDSDYRGEIAVILVNNGTDDFTITHGMRIAQMVIAAVTIMTPVEADDLDDTARAAGGFGSTGL